MGAPQRKHKDEERAEEEDEDDDSEDEEETHNHHLPPTKMENQPAPVPVPNPKTPTVVTTAALPTYPDPNTVYYTATKPSSTTTSRNPQFATFIVVILLLIALAILILYFLYRPSTPHFSILSASIFLLNTTTLSPPTPPTPIITTTIQFTLLIHNPSPRTGLLYDHLIATLYYHDDIHLIAPPTPLPPLHQSSKSTVTAALLIGEEAVAVPIPPSIADAVRDDVTRYGVMGMRLVVGGRVRYKVVGGLIKTTHRRVHVRCDVLAGVGSANGYVTALSTGVVFGGQQVPLLGNPNCRVHI